MKTCNNKLTSIIRTSEEQIANIDRPTFINLHFNLCHVICSNVTLQFTRAADIYIYQWVIGTIFKKKYHNLIRATKRLTSHAFLFQVNSLSLKLIFIFVKASHWFFILLFASHNPISRGSCFQLLQLLFFVYSSIFLQNTHVFPLLVLSITNTAHLFHIKAGEKSYFSLQQPSSFFFLIFLIYLHPIFCYISS